MHREGAPSLVRWFLGATAAPPATPKGRAQRLCGTDPTGSDPEEGSGGPDRYILSPVKAPGRGFGSVGIRARLRENAFPQRPGRLKFNGVGDGDRPIFMRWGVGT